MQAARQPSASEFGLLFLREALGEEKMVLAEASSILLSLPTEVCYRNDYKLSMGKSDSRMERWGVSHALHELGKKNDR